MTDAFWATQDAPPQTAPHQTSDALQRAVSLLPPVPRTVHRRRTVDESLRSGARLTTIHAPHGYGATTAVGAWARREIGRGTPVVWVSARPRPEGTRTGTGGDALAARVHDALAYVVGRTPAPGLAPDRVPTPDDVADRLDAEGAVLVVDDVVPATRGVLAPLEAVARRMRHGRVVCVTTARPPHDGPPAGDALGLTLDDLAVTADEAVQAAKLSGVWLDGELAEILVDHLAGWAHGVFGAVADLTAAGARGEPITEELVLGTTRRHRSRALQGLPRDVVELMLDVSVAEDFDVVDLGLLTNVARPREQLARLQDAGAVVRGHGPGGVTYALRPRLRTAFLEVARRRHPARVSARALGASSSRLARGHARRALLLELESADAARVEQTLDGTWTRLLDGSDDHAPESLWAALGGATSRDVPARLVLLLTAVRPPLGVVRHAPARDVPARTEALPDDAAVLPAVPARTAADALETFLDVVGLRRAGCHGEALARSRAWLRTAGGTGPDPSAAPADAATTTLVALQGALAALEGWQPAEASLLAQLAHHEALRAGLLRLAGAGAGLAALAESLGEDVRGARAWLVELDALPRPPRWWTAVTGDVRGLVDALTALASADPARAASAATSPAVLDSVDSDLWYVGLHVEAGAAVLNGRPAVAADHLRATLARRGPVHRRDDAPAPDLTRAPPLVALDLGRLYLAMGHGTTAATVEAALAPGSVAHALLRTRVAIARGDAATALRSAAPLTSQDGLSVGPRTEAHVVTAEALHATGDVEGARAELARAASFSRRHGSLLAFGWAATSLDSLLALADPSTHDLIAPLRHEVGAPSEVAFVQLPERQLLVLQALADGLTGPEIARDFFVSRNTVKTQVREIYRRLRVHDKAEAVRRAHELGLLDPINRPQAPR